MKYKGKIGYITNDKLYGGSAEAGHYVIVKDYDYNSRKVIVNKITSLEDKPYKFYDDRIKKVRNGFLLPIAKKDCNFSKWSAIDYTNHKVKLSDINFSGKKKINRKYQFNIRKK